MNIDDKNPPSMEEMEALLRHLQGEKKLDDGEINISKQPQQVVSCI
jgi:hypothetical protein